MDMNQRAYDVAVIGGGAAGLSAALVLSRARRSVLVVDTGQPRNAPATHMHGYLSRDGLPPSDLLLRGREEVTSYGGNIFEGRVTDLVPNGRTGFWALLEGGHRIAARRVIVTTGLRDEIPIFPACVSGGPATCCTARTATGTRFATVSSASPNGSPSAVRYAQIVRQWTHDLVYFTPPDLLTAADRSELAARGVGVVEGTIEQLVLDGEDRLRGVRMADGSVVPRDVLF